jgi:myo-inositol-1(or 4)-monophosphatase
MHTTATRSKPSRDIDFFMLRSALLNVMTAAARKAGRSLKRDFGEVENLQVSLKGPGDFVSAADHRADKTLIAELRKARPAYGFLTEESGELPGDDRGNRWIIDPLDGTTNFLHGIPLFSISLALEREGQLVAGVVYNPIINELYVAERGAGAFLNDRRLRVASRQRLADTVIATGMPRLGRGDDAYLGELDGIMRQTAGIRRCGSAALDLAWVASGRFDGFWERGLSTWDVAAGILLVREAGGFVTDLRGGSNGLPGGSVPGSVLAGNEAIHGALLPIIAAADTRR